MGIEMRTVVLGATVRKTEMSVGKQFEVNNSDGMWMVRAQSPDFLYVDGTTRDRFSWATDGALKDGINSFQLKTMIPGVTTQFCWTEDAQPK